MKPILDMPGLERENLAGTAAIKTISRSYCFLCEQKGQQLYSGLSDWLFGAPSVWNLRECRPCGVLWLDPGPAPEDISKLYKRYYTHKGNDPTTFQALRLDIRQHVLARMGYKAALPKGTVSRVLSHVPAIARASALDVMGLPAAGARRLLDLGCGSGEFIGRMSSLGWSAAGVDPDPAAVQRGRDSGLDIQLGTIGDLPEGELYDVITMNHVIEHVPDPVDLLRECHKRLNPSGVILITTPNIDSLGHRWFKEYWRGLEVPRHLLLFSPKALSQCVTRSGMRVRSMRTETRLARMIFAPSVCAQAGEQDVGDRADFPVSTKCWSYLFQCLEEANLFFNWRAGEELYCVCAAKDGNGS